jgi:hypothetical protein
MSTGETRRPEVGTGRNLEAPPCPHCGEIIPNGILSVQIADTRDDLYVQCLTQGCAGELHVARDHQSQALPIKNYFWR